MNLITLFKGPRNRFPIYILIVIIVVGCTNFYKFRENYTSATDLLNNTDGLTEKPFLKAHTNAGEVIILYDTWSVDTITNIVLGEGKKFDVFHEFI